VETPAVPARLIGAIFVEKGLITEKELERALEVQKGTGTRLGEILVAQFGVSRLDLASVLADQWEALERPRRLTLSDDGSPGPNAELTAPEADLDEATTTWTEADDQARRPIGEIFVEQGTITEEQLRQALTVQQETGQRLGEVLVAQGSLSRLELASALADQWGALHRLRPPAPPEPQGRLRPPGAATEPPSDELAQRQLEGLVEELRTKVDMLAGRLAEQDQRLTDAEAADLRGELDRLRAELEPRLEAFENVTLGAAQRIGDLATELPPLANQLTALQARLETLAPDQLQDRIDGLGARIGALEASDQTAALRSELASLVAGLAKLRGDVAAAADRSGETQLREELNRRLATLEERLHEAAGTESRVREQLGELNTRSTAELRAELEGVRGELRDDLNALRDRLERLGAADEPRIEEITGQLERLAVAVDEREGALIARIGGVEQRLAEAGSEREAGAALVDELRDESGARASELQRAVEGIQVRLEQLGASNDPRIEEIAGQLERLALAAREREAATAARIEAVELRLAEAGSAHAAQLVEELRAEMQVVRGELRDDLNVMRDRLEQLGAADDPRIEEIAGQLARLELAADEHVEELRHESRARVDELRHDFNALRESLEQLSAGDARIEDVGRRLEQLGLAARDREAALEARVDALEQRLAEAGSEQAAPLVEELRAELHGVRGELRDDLNVVRDRLGQLGSADDPRVEEITQRLERLAEATGEREAALGARVEAVEQRLTESRSDGALVDELRFESRAQLDELRAAVESIQARLDHSQTAADRRVDDLVGLVDHLVGVASALQPRLDELERRLSEGHSGSAVDELRGRLDELAASVSARAHSIEEELRARTDALELGIEGGVSAPAVDELRRAFDELARGVDERDAHIERRLSAQLERKLESVADRATVDELSRRVDEQERRLDESLGQRVDALASGLHRRIDDISDAVSAAREELAGAADALRADFSAGEARSADQVASVAAELDLVKSELTEAQERSHGLADRLDARERALRDELHAAVASLAREGSTDDEALGELRAALADLDRRLDDQAARADEQVGVTKRALRDGLATLAGRLGETESAYVEAGDALRRSIERLGRAISDADDRIAARGHGDVADQAVEATEFLAFAPTREGYHLVACEGDPPPVGGRLQLPACEGELVVTRIGRSPLPLDERPCAYLEQIRS
jgi:chromosome segregation ATPase